MHGLPKGNNYFRNDNACGLWLYALIPVSYNKGDGTCTFLKKKKPSFTYINSVLKNFVYFPNPDYHVPVQPV